MKTGIITIVTMAAMAAGLAAPAIAEADHRSVDVRMQIGPAYVRYHDGFYRADRVYPDWRRRTAYYRRAVAAHELWHHCYDGHWYRYYDEKHWKKHHKRRGKDRHRGNRYRDHRYDDRHRGHRH